MGEVFEKLGRLKPVIAVSKDDFPESRLRTIPGFAGTHDPHIWFNVNLWEETVKAVKGFMIEYSSASPDLYTQECQRIPETDGFAGAR